MSDFVALLMHVFFSGFIITFLMDLVIKEVDRIWAPRLPIMARLPLWANKSAIPIGLWFTTLTSHNGNFLSSQ